MEHEMSVHLLDLKGLRVPPEHREIEAGLINIRWFDYRGLHPVQATHLYAEAYQTQTRKFYESVVDIRTVEKIKAFIPDDIFMSRDLTSMWIARQTADSLCIPYDFIMRFAQERFFNRTMRHFPRPNQLYGEEFEIDLVAAWSETLQRQITYAKSDWYRAGQWEGHPNQSEHVQFVLDQIKRRQAPHFRLLARMYAEDVLDPGQMGQAFSAFEVQQAVAYAEEYLMVSKR